MRELMSLTLRIRLPVGRTWASRMLKTTLWSDYPLGIVRKERDGLEAFNICDFLFQKAYY
jgi:hypothetical protein